ncbi:MAG: hypothetical protein ACKE9I_03120 [Methylophagaceae bacterium]
MSSQIKLFFTALFLAAVISACGTKTSEIEIEVGMSEQDIIEILGEPSLTQSNTIDDLVSTHVEWSDEKGTLSVQFINGKAQYNQFIALSN